MKAIVKIAVGFIAAAVSCLGAQSEICPGQTAFQFPLWSDASWKHFANYSSIQMADIDGDGQAELLGAGLNGVEAWHWDPAGQQWYQLPGLGPILLGPRDSIAAADLDGDGKAELIQSTVATNSSATLNVFHYDVNPGVWRLLPKLTTTVPAIYSRYQNVLGAPLIQVSPAIFRFADLLNTGQQELIYFTTTTAGSTLYAAATVYSAKKDDSAWVPLNTGAYPQQITSGLLRDDYQIANLAANKKQIVIEDGASFVFLRSVVNGTDFAAPYRRKISGYSPGTFALVDFAGSGVDQVAFQLPYAAGVQQLYYSTDADAVSSSPLSVTAMSTVSTSPELAILRSAKTGLGLNANSKDLIGFIGNDNIGLAEWGLTKLVPTAVLVSATPSISERRFGDDPAHYSTIQIGAVHELSGATESLLISRDSAAIHTMVTTPNVCQSSVPGFTTKAVTWFPAFATKGQTLAYTYISQQVTFGSSSDIRSTYPNLLGDVTGYQSSLPGVTYTPTPQFTQADFDFVKNQINYELESVANVRQFFSQTQQELNDIYDGEQAALPSIFDALNAQPDTSAYVAYENGWATVKAVLNDIYGVAAGIVEFAELPIYGETPPEPLVPGQTEPTNPATTATVFYDIMSSIGTVISDVQGAPSPSGSGSPPVKQTLAQISQQVGAWKSKAESNNAQSETQLLSNWDLLRTQSQRIASNVLETTPEQDVAIVNSAVNGWAVETWQALAPQFWSVVIAPYTTAFGGLSVNCIICSSSYTYFVQGQEPVPSGDPDPNDQKYHWVAWLEVQGAPDYNPVPPASMQQFTGSGINLRDVVARRNGWQNMPLDTSNDIYGFLNLNAIVFPPDPTPPPVTTTQLAANLVISGGSPENVYSCSGTQTELGQSTPVNSLFPEPVTIQVQDINGNGIPNATVAVKAPALVTSSFTITTDANGSATVSLEANGNVAPPTQAFFSVQTPKMDPNAVPCQVSSVPYSLETTPSTQPGNSSDLTAKFNVPSRTGPVNSRTWQLQWAFTQGADALTALATPTLNITQAGASSCPATVKSVTQPTANANGTGTIYTASAVITFSGPGCSAARTYNLQVSTLATLKLDDGNTFTVPISNTLSTQP